MRSLHIPTLAAMLLLGLSACSSSTVTTTPQGVSAVRISPNAVQMLAGESKVLDAQVTASGSVDQSVTWSSTNPSVVVVDASGKVTALKAGSATITATSKQNSAKAGNSSITVQEPGVVNSVSVTPSNLDLQVGGTQSLSAKVTGTGSFDSTLNWTSSDASVAAVDSTGMVTGLKEGTATIMATSKANSTLKATASVKVSKASSDPFNITIVFPANTLLTPSQKQAFTEAASRWSQVIAQGLPDFNGTANGKPLSVDDVQINADAVAIDGVGNILGMAGPEFVRNENSLPITGIMKFDSADVANMEARGTLKSVILHEMGHVLGIGTLWDSFITHNGNVDCQNASIIEFTGAKALLQFHNLGKAGNIPVETTGGKGTKCGHWSESHFDSELMTGFSESGPMPLSRMTVGALEDLGYQVNYNAADPYTVPVKPSGIEKQSLEHGELLLKPRGRL
ncbi:hypothetical protein DC3_31530 [Deinococcus cellulosilyticus NBRC 106333 = KACC 11606]|uniref:BIG2 domain-containing protein n=2 Tax=Deinococcus cellulosilyticus TaxID=401558 RepID=A0A511N4W5_DEIC1|nr:hypothetical protein DC3_31530 [Deinococcus cellulosilyticus NBRC 106333 = KACC 11606]